MGQFIEIVSDDERNVFESGDSKIFYRRFDSEVFYKIQKKWTTKKGIDKRSGMPKMETDDKAVNDELLDWLIVDWKNIKNPQTGSDVPCTKENKLKLPSSIKAALIERADSESTQNDADENALKN